MIKDDPTIERIRKAREQISETLGNDPKQFVEYYIELQKQYKDRLINVNEEEHKVLLHESNS